MNETSSYLQTVGRALEILELIGRFPGLTLSELARRTGRFAISRPCVQVTFSAQKKLLVQQGAFLFYKISKS